MSFSELQVLTDIANRGDFYSQRDEFNVAMMLSDEVDASIENLYALRDAAESNEDLTSLEALVAPDLKELTGQTEISVEALSTLVIIGIVAVLGAIMALLIWLIRSFSKTGSAVSSTTDAAKNLMNDISRAAANLKPSQEVQEAVAGVLKRTEEVLNQARQTDKLQDEVVARAKALLSQPDPIEIIKVPEERIPEDNKEEREESAVEYMRRCRELRETAKRELQEEAKLLLTANGVKNRRNIQDAVHKHEKALHSELKQLRASITDNPIILFDQDSIVDFSSLGNIGETVHTTIATVQDKLNKTKELIRASQTSFSTIERFVFGVARTLAGWTHIKRDNSYGKADEEKFKEYLDAIVEELKTGVHKTIEEKGRLESYDERTFESYRKIHEEVKKLHEFAGKNIVENVVLTQGAFDDAINATVSIQKQLNDTVNGAKRISIQQIFQNITDAIQNELREKLLGKIKDGLVEYGDFVSGGNKSIDLTSTYFDMGKKVGGVLQKYTYVKNTIDRVDAERLVKQAEELNGEVDAYQTKIKNAQSQGELTHILDDEETGEKKTFLAFFNALIDPYLTIAVSSKALIAAYINTLYTIQHISRGIEDAEDKAMKALQSAFADTLRSDKVQSALGRIVLDVASQMTRFFVRPERKVN